MAVSKIPKSKNWSHWLRIVKNLTERQEHTDLHIKRLILKIPIVWRKRILTLSTAVTVEYILNGILKGIGMMVKMMFHTKCMILHEIF